MLARTASGEPNSMSREVDRQLEPLDILTNGIFISRKHKLVKSHPRVVTQVDIFNKASQYEKELLRERTYGRTRE
jgi:hypothetical protein